MAGYEVAESKNVAFADFVSRAAFDMFSSVMYGESPRTTDSVVVDPKDLVFVTSSQTAFELTGRLLVNPLEKIFGGDIYRSFKVNMDSTMAIANDKTAECMARAKEERRGPGAEGGVAAGEGENEAESGGCPVTAVKNSFIGRLMNRGRLSAGDIQSISGPLLMAGVDTTAYTMCWLFLNLASNPDVQAKLAEELRAVLGGADVTTAEQMRSLPYLKACMRESHRLTPAASVMTKTLREDVDMVVAKNETYRIPAGMRVSLNLRASHGPASRRRPVVVRAGALPPRRRAREGGHAVGGGPRSPVLRGSVREGEETVPRLELGHRGNIRPGREDDTGLRGFPRGSEGGVEAEAKADADGRPIPGHQTCTSRLEVDISASMFVCKELNISN